MAKHADDEPVTVGYSASSNISFHGKGHELGVTWGEWRDMDESARRETMDEFVHSLIDVYVEGDDD